MFLLRTSMQRYQKEFVSTIEMLTVTETCRHSKICRSCKHWPRNAYTNNRTSVDNNTDALVAFQGKTFQLAAAVNVLNHND